MLSTVKSSSIRYTTIRALSKSRIASNKFQEKEAGDEAIYIKKHEADQLRKLKEQLEKLKKDLAELEAKLKQSKN